jgi:hypothetical protein
MLVPLMVTSGVLIPSPNSRAGSGAERTPGLRRRTCASIHENTPEEQQSNQHDRAGGQTDHPLRLPEVGDLPRDRSDRA